MKYNISIGLNHFHRQSCVKKNYCKHGTVNDVKDPLVAHSFWQPDKAAELILWFEYKQREGGKEDHK